MIGIGTLLGDLFCSPAHRKLRRWVRRTDLPGTDYVVKRRYHDYEAFIELRWTVYDKDKEKHIFYYDKRCRLKHAVMIINDMERGELLWKIRHEGTDNSL